MVRRKIFYGTMLAAGLASLSVPAKAADARGVWLRSEGTSRVKVAPCGGALCGTVVWLRDSGGPGKVGQRVFFDMKPAGADTWEGSAFNPEDGRTYSGKMEVSGNALTTTGLRARRDDLQVGELVAGELREPTCFDVMQGRARRESGIRERRFADCASKVRLRDRASLDRHGLRVSRIFTTLRPG